MHKPSNTRRSLSHVGGEVESRGELRRAGLLADALRVPPARKPGGRGEGPDRQDVHGFHTYPARMHPLTAARLVQAFAPIGGSVLDPFCGSGTVLVEALRAGRSAVGVDLNPLAVRLSQSKVDASLGRTPSRLLAEGERVVTLAEERRLARAGSSRRYPDEDVLLFEPHVLLELDSLRVGIAATDTPALRRDLELVLSAILVKLSRQEGDTTRRMGPRRTAAGAAIELFSRKLKEYTVRRSAFVASLPAPSVEAQVFAVDARKLQGLSPASLDTVITSPPYPGHYDYLSHHALRMRWLNLSQRAFEEGEVGARRRFVPLPFVDAVALWVEELSQVFAALGRVLKPKGVAILLLADVPHVSPQPPRGGRLLARPPAKLIRASQVACQAAESQGFSWIASASQARPTFLPGSPSGNLPRREHALLFQHR